LAAWCLLRHDYRHFRIDRIVSLADSPAVWPDTASLDAFLQHSDAGDRARERLYRQTHQPWHR
jgi:predicted DNA-binding transcriptional regulator YafY